MDPRDNTTLRNNIQKDIERFSKLHMWYKHLSYDGKEFLIFPWKGHQPKNCFDPQIEDNINLHWWIYYADFIDEIPLHGRGKEIIMQNPIRFNCFLRGIEIDCHTNGHPYFRGWFLLKRKYPKINKFLRKKYPHVKNDIIEFANIEHFNQLEEAKIRAGIIFNAMRKDCPEWISGQNLLSLAKSDSSLSHKMSTLSMNDLSVLCCDQRSSPDKLSEIINDDFQDDFEDDFESDEPCNCDKESTGPKITKSKFILDLSVIHSIGSHHSPSPSSSPSSSPYPSPSSSSYPSPSSSPSSYPSSSSSPSSYPSPSSSSSSSSSDSHSPHSPHSSIFSLISSSLFHSPRSQTQSQKSSSLQKSPTFVEEPYNIHYPKKRHISIFHKSSSKSSHMVVGKDSDVSPKQNAIFSKKYSH